jgi:hypothetical protein
MKQPRKIQRLLDDVLADTVSADFSEAVLERTLRQARRRQRIRRSQQTVLIVAVLAALIFWLWPRERPVPIQAEKESRPILLALPVVNFVETLPLPPGMIVETRAGLAAMILASPSTLKLVETLPAGELFRQLNDDQLLALVAGRPVALVRYGPHDAMIVMSEEIVDHGFRLE